MSDQRSPCLCYRPLNISAKLARPSRFNVTEAYEGLPICWWSVLWSTLLINFPGSTRLGSLHTTLVYEPWSCTSRWDDWWIPSSRFSVLNFPLLDVVDFGSWTLLEISRPTEVLANTSRIAFLEPLSPMWIIRTLLCRENHHVNRSLLMLVDLPQHDRGQAYDLNQEL
jgi:hypothetical protein